MSDPLTDQLEFIAQSFKLVGDPKLFPWMEDDAILKALYDAYQAGIDYGMSQIKACVCKG